MSVEESISFRTGLAVLIGCVLLTGVMIATAWYVFWPRPSLVATTTSTPALPSIGGSATPSSPAETPKPEAPPVGQGVPTELPTANSDGGLGISPEEVIPTPVPVPVLTATPPGEGIADPNYLAGKAAYEAGQYQEVLDRMALVLEADPSLAPPHWYRGMAYYYLGDDVAALAEMEAALALDPTYALAYAGRGLVHMEMGDEARAFADWRRALELDPTLAKVHCHMGVAYFNRGDYKASLEAYDACLAIDPLRAGAWASRADALVELGRPECLQSANRALELQPDLWRGYFVRSGCYASLGLWEEAVADMTVFLEVEPGSAEGWYNRGVYHRKGGQDDRAIEDYTRAHLLDPDWTWPLINRSAVYQDQNELELAYTDLAEVSLYGGDYADAISRATAALSEVRPESDNLARIYFIRGQAHYYTGEYGNAIDDLSQAIEIKPDPLAYYYRGIAYHTSRLNEEAVRDLEIFLVEADEGYVAYIADAQARLSLLKD